ncbi:conserved hypothetical protein [Leishmania major strain Friedlin]|uniref:ER-Golgi trafficking TRAPP I complex 85 kDa subunit family protein n=1 Tax=Leishmania major TaxID=5664 RepID=Q4Q9T4_LEIMA|nr:conserved hypothetical protein [Leishmania major strain Friedlin]CAG9575176.1 ER-Golgi_trafficking_TRAPP_I_complex_85_kDa_subunit_-_putative [Leishmania major strain Friedlin]CAJ05332.1 conserved hypothetical protein [Leishmania major strain Friedlin]|eukprot:XP_001683914.1 conserved hypothetical protein [Leishmania major strain Friedlin]
MSLEDWVEQRYARPVVVVESSAAADAICARNGMDLIHLLRLHSVYAGGPLYARIGDRSEPVVCNKFGVRLMRTECVRDVSLSQVARHTRHLLRNAAAFDLAYGEQLDAALRAIVEKNRSRHDGSLPRPVRAAQPSTESPSPPAPFEVIGGPAAVSTLLERACPTWHRAFIRDLHSLVRCSPFDTIDYPIGALFAVATTEAGGVEGMLQVFRLQARRIQELRASLPGMDTELHQYYLILHDNTSPLSPSLSTARQVLTSVQQLYGANYCALIKVNSVVDPRTVKNLDPSMWIAASPMAMDVPSAQALHQAAAQAAAAAAAPASTVTASQSPSASTASPSSGAASPSGTAADRAPALSFRAVHRTCGTWPNSNTAIITGCYMSPEDVTDVHNVMAHYLSQSLFKFVERRLRMLDVSVQDRRTTTLSKMAAWFKGKDEGRPRTADVVNTPNGFDSSAFPRYVAHSLEMQMRHCGDLSLALHDLKGAISYYRMCIEELLETLALRSYNRALIAACQEGIGVAQLLQGKLVPQSLTPWYTSVTSATQRVSSQTNRWEVAWNDYLAAGMPTHAVRVAFLLYESSRVRTPPMLDRCHAILTHLQRSGILQRQNLLSGVVNDMLAGIAAFTNPPFPAGLEVPPSIPRDYPVYMSLRRFAQRMQRAGALYRAGNSLEQALRCYLRVLELLRTIDPQESWKTLAEHLYLTAGQLYMQLGQDVRGIAMTSVAVAQGTPLYRHPATAQQAFEGFWAQQKRMLSSMGYALCPHMPMPRILRDSFRVDRNYYSTDTLTDDAARKMGEAAAETEWHSMEKHLKKNYTETVLRAHPSCRFPAFHGGGKYGCGGTAHGRRSQGGHGGCHNTANNGYRYSTAADGRSGASSPAVSQHPGARQDDHVFPMAGAASGSAAQPQRHYTIAKAEPLVLNFVMENIIGCSIEATNLTLLYLDYVSPEQLWKSSMTQTVRLEAGASRRVSLSFDPVSEGEYAIIGLCWSLLGQEGYYYFATRENRPGCPESLYEYAIENPMPALDAPENIHVSVTPSKACVTATFQPPIPEHLYDGEYFYTNLVVCNTSAQQDAAHVVLQRSPAASHLMYIEEFGRLQNLKREAPLVLAEHLKAQETRTFAVTIRAQHRRSDAALQNTPNYFFLLLGYLSGPLPEPEKLPPCLFASAAELDPANATPPTESSLTSTIALPTSPPHRQLHSPTTPVAGHKAAGGPAVMVRLHRLLRRCEVQPVLAMHSTVLPPANASLQTAVVLTVKNISPAAARAPVTATAVTAITTTSGEPASITPASTPDAVQAVPVSSSGSAALSCHTHARGHSYAPVRVARVLVVHSPRWGVEHKGTEELFADRAVHCLLSHGDSLALPLLVKRQSHAAEGADTTVRRVSLSDDAAAASVEAQCPYRDTMCIALAKALPSSARAKAVEEHLGTSVSQSERNLFFLQTSCVGPGHVGARPFADEAGGGLAFYADKAGQQKEAAKTAKQRRCDEADEERRLCGGPIEQYTPLAIAVAWVREEGGGAENQEKHSGVGGDLSQREGQVFLFVDPIEHVYQTVAQQQKRQAEQESVTSLQPALSAVRAGVSAEQTQQELCEAMLVRYASLKRWQGALVSHVQAPSVVRVTQGRSSDKTVAAPVPVTLRCLSLAPVPLLVTAEALPPSVPHHSLSSLKHAREGGARGDWAASPATPPPSPPAAMTASGPDVPVLFVGKTVHTFLLMPSEEYEVQFTALALRPGLVDCQRISLSAAPICYLHSTTEKDDDGADEIRGTEGAQPLMCTGMTLPSLIRAVLTHKTPSAAPRTAPRVLLSDRQLSGRQQPNDDADMRSGAERCERRRALQGYLAAAAHSSVMTLVERYGTRAAELVRQLAPLGPAGGATVSQVMPCTAPALTRVIMLDDHAATSTAVGEGAGVAMRKATPAAAPVATVSAPSTAAAAATRSHDAARKFFRQLEIFETELQRARLGSVSDPHGLQYVYRPTVKMAGGGTSRVGHCTADNSFATTPMSAAAPPPLTEEAVTIGNGGVAAPDSFGGSWVADLVSATSRKMDSLARPAVVTVFGAQGTLSSVRSPAQQPCDDAEELGSPLHLPAVAFESHAVEAAFALDISETSSPLQGSHSGPHPLSGADEMGSVECIAELAVCEDSDSLCVTDTKTQIDLVSPMRQLRSSGVNVAGATDVCDGTEVLMTAADAKDTETWTSPAARHAPALPRHSQETGNSALAHDPLSPSSASSNAAASPTGFTADVAAGIPPPSPSSSPLPPSGAAAVDVTTPPT